jgi:hypothetical protein
MTTREFSSDASAFSLDAALDQIDRLAAQLERQSTERAIYEQRAIAEVFDLREAVLEHMHPSASCALPVDAQKSNRQNHLRPFAKLLREMLAIDSPNAQIRAFARNLALAKNLGWKKCDMRELPPAFDARFNDPEDLLIPFLKLIFQDQEAGLLRTWMHALDAHVNASSSANVAAIDHAARTRHKPVRKDVVLVGGSALTALVASILDPYFRLTVITQHGLGRPWRDRPIFINSSATVKDFNGPALPLLPGPTTRIVGSQQLNSLEVDALLGGDTLRVPCDDGSIVEYVSGFRLGDLIATNILLYADDYITGLALDVSKLRRNADGGTRLTLVAEDGTTREMDASAVFLLTGPGGERTAVPDRETQKLYRKMARQVDLAIRQDRKHMGWYQESLRKLEPEALTCSMQMQWMRSQRKEHKIPLPRVLTLSSIETLYRYWLSDLSAEPDLFPFTELMCHPHSIGYIGNGDTMRTVKDLLEKRGPAAAYPANLGRVRVRGVIYNERADSPEDYNARNRRRYQGVYDRNTFSVPFKVVAYRVVEIDEERAYVEVDYREDDGTLQTNSHDYIVDATGLNRLPIEEFLPDAFAVRDIRDLEGNVVARGNPDADLYICGSATQFQATALPIELQRIISILGISENTVSLWVHGVLAERHALSFAATHQATKWSTEGKRMS